MLLFFASPSDDVTHSPRFSRGVALISLPGRSLKKLKKGATVAAMVFSGDSVDDCNTLVGRTEQIQ